MVERLNLNSSKVVILTKMDLMEFMQILIYIQYLLNLTMPEQMLLKDFLENFLENSKKNLKK